MEKNNITANAEFVTGKKTVTFNLPINVINELKKESKHRHINMSILVQLALEKTYKIK